MEAAAGAHRLAAPDLLVEAATRAHGLRVAVRFRLHVGQRALLVHDLRECRAGSAWGVWGRCFCVLGVSWVSWKCLGTAVMLHVVRGLTTTHGPELIGKARDVAGPEHSRSTARSTLEHLL